MATEAVLQLAQLQLRILLAVVGRYPSIESNSRWGRAHLVSSVLGPRL
jgi:hypothetical protein